MLVPTCTSSGGFFITSLLKLHWDSRTCARTKCTSPLLPCKEPSKVFSKHHFPVSYLTGKGKSPVGPWTQSFKTPSLTLLFGFLNNLAWIIQLPVSSSNLTVKAAITWPCKNCVLASQLHPTCVSWLLQITRQDFQKNVSTPFPVFDHQVLYCMGYFEFSSLFWGRKEENEIKAVTEGKSGSDYSCAMFKIFNSTVWVTMTWLLLTWVTWVNIA